MARPRKTGIDYFPFDSDFFADKKIKVLKSRFGADGITIYLYLLCEIYKNGYFLSVDDDFEYIMADDLGMSGEKVKQVMKFLLERSLLESILFQSDTIITSRGIQRRFQEAVKGRASKSVIWVEKDLWLLSDEETQPYIKVTKNPSYSEKNPSYSEKNPSYSMEKCHKVNKSKVKESKVNNIEEYIPNGTYSSSPESAINAAPKMSKPVISILLRDGTYYEVTDEEMMHWKELFPKLDVEQEFRSMAGWCEANPQKRKTRKGFKRFVNSWLMRATQNNPNGRQQKNNSMDALEEWLNDRQ